MLLLRQLACRRAAPLLARWCESPSGLSAEERARVAAHIARCAACRDQFETMRRMADLLRRERPAAACPAPDLWARLQSRIAEEPQDPAPLLPDLPNREPLATPPAGWGRALARTVPIGVAATLGLFVLTFRADFTALRGPVPRIDGSAVVMPSLPPPAEVAIADDSVSAPRATPGAPALAPAVRRPAPGAAAMRVSAAPTLASAREQAAEAMRRDARDARDASGGGRGSAGRDNPFEPLRRPASPPVLTAPTAVAGVSAPGPSAPAPAPLRGRPGSVAAVVAPSARATSSVSSSVAASLEPPTARPPQMVAMAPRPPVRVAPGGGIATSDPAHEPNEPADRDPKPPVTFAASDGAAAPTKASVAASKQGDGVRTAAAARRPVEVAALTGSVRGDAETAPSAVDTVSAHRRQLGLFHYGGGMAEPGTTGRQP